MSQKLMQGTSYDDILVESLSSLFGLMGLIGASKDVKQDELKSVIVKQGLETLVSLIQKSK
jgi:hypothetical protein